MLSETSFFFQEIYETLVGHWHSINFVNLNIKNILTVGPYTFLDFFTTFSLSTSVLVTIYFIDWPKRIPYSRHAIRCTYCWGEWTGQLAPVASTTLLHHLPCPPNNFSAHRGGDSVVTRKLIFCLSFCRCVLQIQMFQYWCWLQSLQVQVLWYHARLPMVAVCYITFIHFIIKVILSTEIVTAERIN
jgi:hypothetical protein